MNINTSSSSSPEIITNTADWCIPTVSITGTGFQRDLSGLEKMTINTNQSILININAHMHYEIKKIIQHVPNKVYEFIFYDRQRIKTICSEEDNFDFDYACFLAIAKKLYSKTLTFEGVLSKVSEIATIKQYIKIVKQAKKQFFEEKEKEQKAKKEEELRRKQHEKYVEKKIQRKQKKKQILVDTIKIALQDVYNTNK